MDHQAFLSECPQAIFFGDPGKMISDHSIMSSENHDNHGFIALKQEPMEDIGLTGNHVEHFIFQEPVENEIIVEQSIDPDSVDDREIIIMPNNMIKQEDIIEDSEVTIGSSVANEVIISDHLVDADRFGIAASIEMGTNPMDDEAFDDTKLIIDTAQYGLDDSACFTYDCSECDAQMNSRTSLRKHMRSEHGKFQRSKARKISYNDDMLLDKHYMCPSCSYTTQRRDKLDKHMQKHVLLDGVHPCGKKRHKPNTMPQRHRHNAEEYKCPHCPYSCTVYRAMKKHNKLHFMMEEEAFPLKLSCKICGKDRTTKSALERHMQKHIRGKSFLCDKCNFSSIQLKKIIQHRRMHTGEKPHLCPHCNYRSARRDNLRSHVRRMHKKENMYIDTFNPHEHVAEVGLGNDI